MPDEIEQEQQLAERQRELARLHNERLEAWVRGAERTAAALGFAAGATTAAFEMMRLRYANM